MKLVCAVIKPHRLEPVKKALERIGVRGLTVSEVQGFGRQHGHSETYRGTEYTVSFNPKTRLEILVTDDVVDTVVDTIVTEARTDSIGDGKLWVLDVGRAVRIRTGEEGDDAL